LRRARVVGDGLAFDGGECAGGAESFGQVFEGAAVAGDGRGLEVAVLGVLEEGFCGAVEGGCGWGFGGEIAAGFEDLNATEGAVLIGGSEGLAVAGPIELAIAPDGAVAKVKFWPLQMWRQEARWRLWGGDHGRIVSTFCHAVWHVTAFCLEVVYFLLFVWRKPVGVEPTCDTKYRTTGLKPAPSTGQEWLPRRL